MGPCNLATRVEHSHWSRSIEIRCFDWSLFAWITSLRHPKPPDKGIYCLALSNGGFHAGKWSIIGAGVSNIMIPPIIDSFCACPPITVSLVNHRPRVLQSNQGYTELCRHFWSWNCFHHWLENLHQVHPANRETIKKPINVGIYIDPINCSFSCRLGWGIILTNTNWSL